MKRLRPLLGTYVTIEVEDPGANHATSAIDAAFAAIELVHRLMSVQQADSDISRVNRDAWRRPVTVHPWTLKTLRWALLIHGATNGLFDCAVGHELGQYGLVAGHGFEDAEQGSLADVEIGRDDSVRFSRRIALDLGGIAKGFAVDRAIATLRARRIRRAVVNAGGDLRVIGPEPHPIHVQDRDNGCVRLAGLLANGAIATSGTAAMIDVGRRTPVGDGRTYSVVAPRCVVADALTKVVAQTGQLEAPWLSRFGASVWTAPQLAAAA